MNKLLLLIAIVFLNVLPCRSDAYAFGQNNVQPVAREGNNARGVDLQGNSAEQTGTDLSGKPIKKTNIFIRIVGAVTVFLEMLAQGLLK